MALCGEEAECSSESYINAYQTARYLNPEDHNVWITDDDDDNKGNERETMYGHTI